MEPNTTAQPRLTDYIRPLISRWWLILIAVVVATGGVYAYFAHKPNVYSTSTLVYYNDPGDPVTGNPDPAQATDRAVEDQATLLYAPASATAVASRIGYHGTPRALLQQVTISSKQGQDFVQISVNSGTPPQAAAIANGFAQRLVSLLTGGVTAREKGALRTLRTQLAQQPRSSVPTPQSSTLATQISRLQLLLANPPTVSSQVAPAPVPTSPSAPNPTRNALFALILSLVAAIAVAYGLERFDRRLKDPDELEQAYGRPLLAVLPHTGDPAPARDGEPVQSKDFREPFRVLRTNIELASVDAPPRTIVISSAVPGEGKSTVVRNLALAFREAGLRVAVVDLDLRHPALAPLFAVSAGPGITEVLRHDSTLGDAELGIRVGVPSGDAFVRASESIRRGRSAATVRNGANGANGRNGNGGRNGSGPHAEITLLLSGARPANPPAVLASARLVEVLDELREQHDVVLIDSAPVLAVTDTVPLLRYADAALFVGRLGVTTRDTAKRLMEFLGRVPDLNLLGIVANDLSRHEAGSYGYGYGYGPYGDEEPEPSRSREAAAEPPKQTV